MAYIPAKTQQRLAAKMGKFQKLIRKAIDQDINESDTVMIVTDILSEVFGYEKFTEITSEYAIRGTYCDLAVKIRDKVRLLIECKAVGIELKEQYVKQAIDYAVNQGIEWVVLTNGARWKVFRVIFAQPIDKELVADFNFLELKSRSQRDLELLYMLTKEGLEKLALQNYYDKQQAVNKFTIAAILQTPEVISVIRRYVKKLGDGINPGVEDIREILLTEVLKREVVEDEKAREAAKRVAKAIAPRKKKQ